MQVTFENVWAAQPQHSGVIKRKFPVRFRFANLCGNAGRKPADRSQTARWLHVFPGLSRLRIGQVYADHRRGLGESVAFEYFLVEALLKMARKIERQFFRPNDNEAQSA